MPDSSTTFQHTIVAKRDIGGIFAKNDYVLPQWVRDCRAPYHFDAETGGIYAWRVRMDDAWIKSADNNITDQRDRHYFDRALAERAEWLAGKAVA